MVQRIGIAAALYANPDLLILDEPTSALDPEGRAEVIDIVRSLAASGSTILLCTHILNDVERVASKVGILRNGVMAVEGSLEDVRKRFGIGTAVTVRAQDAAAATEVLQGLDAVERVDAEYFGDVTAVAKNGVSEAELFYKTVNALASSQIVPEGVWFKRFSLEQVYLGINSGQLLPR
jgi:ABC-type multidrug transport system ATPase subunit